MGISVEIGPANSEADEDNWAHKMNTIPTLYREDAPVFKWMRPHINALQCNIGSWRGFCEAYGLTHLVPERPPNPWDWGLYRITPERLEQIRAAEKVTLDERENDSRPSMYAWLRFWCEFAVREFEDNAWIEVTY